MGSARQRSKNSWQARWYAADGKLKSETRRGWTKPAAERYAREQEEASRRAPWVTTAPNQAPDVIVYGHKVLDARAITQQKLKSDRAAWINRIAPHLEGLRLTQVTPDDLRTLVIDLTGRYAASTVKDTYGLVRYVFATAQADGLIAATPCVRISLPRRLQEEETVPAEPAAVSAISIAIDPRYKALVLFLAATGCRIGEALAVQISDIALVPKPQVTISRTVHDDATLGPTKTRRSRTISLPQWMVGEIRQQTASHSSELLFPSPNGLPLPVRRFSSRFWRPAARVAGYPDTTPHQVRHLHATQLIELGRPVTEVATRLGHRNSRVTMEIYARWIQPDDSAAAAVVPDYSKTLRAVGD